MILLITNLSIPSTLIYLFNFNKDISKETKNEISLYIHESDEIRKIELEEYIKQVVYAEIPANFEEEAIKAQAVAVRSYTYRKIQNQTHNNADMCTNINHCQAWKEKDESAAYKKISACVEETKGKVATYDEQIINAVYHASSWGYTENSVNVWAGAGTDYLIPVKSVEKNIESELIVSKKDFLEKLKLKNKNIKIKILTKTEGNRVKEISINNEIYNGNKIREIFNLKSTNFDIQVKNNEVKFVVKGYGHGVGLSQWGAQAMAASGKNYEEIIKHYYSGVEIQNINNV